MKQTNFKLKTTVLNRAVSFTVLLLAAVLLLTGCPQKLKEEPKPVYYTVTLTPTVNGTVRSDSDLTKPVHKGTVINFTADPSTGYAVSQWTVSPGLFTEGGQEGSLTAKVTVTANMTVNVIFVNVIGTSEDAGDGFIKIIPSLNGIIGMDPTYPVPINEDIGKGVFIKDRKVKLSPYKLGKTEVTYKLWKEVCDWATGEEYVFANAGKKGSDGTGTDNEPVTFVSWSDCIIWCNAYTQKKNNSEAECVYRKSSSDQTVLKDATDRTACAAAYFDKSKKGYRLPTEAEWEYAARWQGNDSTNADKCGTVWLTKLDSASGAKKPIGTQNTPPQNWDWESLRDELTRVAVYRRWYNGFDFYDQPTKVTKTAAVGSKDANALGLYDMSGNVWECCFDKWDDNPTAGDEPDVNGFVLNPQGAVADSGSVVVRGGCWADSPHGCAVGVRHKQAYSEKDFYMGFRLACRP